MVITSTGLIFASCQDGRVYAYDADNGGVLWSSQMARNTEAMPAMYEVDGRQYLIIPDLGKTIDEDLAEKTPPGYIVYALPQKATRTAANETKN